MIVLRLLKRIKRSNPSYGRDFSYRIGRFELSLPYGHILPAYQQGCPQYDRFLPHLGKYLPVNSVVVDVGANCPDTLASMIDGNPQLKFLRIEADDFFYLYLTSNIDAMRKIIPGPQIKAVKCLADCEISNVIMAEKGGTKNAIAHQGADGGVIRSTRWKRKGLYR